MTYIKVYISDRSQMKSTCWLRIGSIWN